MTQRSIKVCRPEPLSKDKFQTKLAAAWGRVWPRTSKGAMASRMGLNDTKTIDRAVTASNLPEAHTIFNSLCADETALDEVLAAYGFKLIRLHADAANDFDTLADAADLHDEHMNAMRDGVRDHRETLKIADKARPVVRKYQAIISEAERLRASGAA
jgi:type II secretory ATPase GspE/PulE/Tfp pilus assembly ATPase PilB-like protein